MFYKKDEMSHQDWQDLKNFEEQIDISDKLDDLAHMSETEALNHIISVIDSRGLDKCTDKTKQAYDVLKDLSEKLSTDFVIYRP